MASPYIPGGTSLNINRPLSSVVVLGELSPIPAIIGFPSEEYKTSAKRTITPAAGLLRVLSMSVPPTTPNLPEEGEGNAVKRTGVAWGDKLIVAEREGAVGDSKTVTVGLLQPVPRVSKINKTGSSTKTHLIILPSIVRHVLPDKVNGEELH